MKHLVVVRQVNRAKNTKAEDMEVAKISEVEADAILLVEEEENFLISRKRILMVQLIMMSIIIS